MTFVDVGGIA